VHVSEERLESTIEELTRLEMAAHGFHAALSHKVQQPLQPALTGHSSSAFEVAESRQESSSAETAGRATLLPASAEASALRTEIPYRAASDRSTLLQEPQQQRQQQQRSAPPERQRQR